jgi:hypothetical protein
MVVHWCWWWLCREQLALVRHQGRRRVNLEGRRRTCMVQNFRVLVLVYLGIMLSLQYITMYNVQHKEPLDPTSPSTGLLHGQRTAHMAATRR